MKPLQIMCLPAIAGLLLTITGCASPPLTIAAIPLVAPDQIWLDEHVGVLRAAAQEHVRVYWNAPDREGDVQRQISLVQQVEKAHYGGLILAPEQELALTLPVEQVLAAGMPVVIVHTPLALPPGGHLAYVVNDEEKTGELAAQIIGRALHGKGRLAITGVQPLHPSLMRRMRAFERALASDYPAITIAARIPNTRDDFASEENASALIQSPKKVDAIFALDVTAGIGAVRAIQGIVAGKRPVLVVCGQDPLLLAGIRNGDIEAVLAENSLTMGYKAMREIMRMRRGLPVPGMVMVEPILLTRTTLRNPEVLDKVANLPDEPL
jgi:ribose transport system substrate-binding protein